MNKPDFCITCPKNLLEKFESLEEFEGLPKQDGEGFYLAGYYNSSEFSEPIKVYVAPYIENIEITKTYSELSHEDLLNATPYYKYLEPLLDKEKDKK